MMEAQAQPSLSGRPRGHGPYGIRDGIIRVAEKFCRRCKTTRSAEVFGIEEHETPTGRTGRKFEDYCRECMVKSRAWVRDRMAKHGPLQPAFQPKPCIICGGEFTPKTAWHRSCGPDCAREATRRSCGRAPLAPATYERLYREQSGRCASCGDPHERLAVDHCHATGETRGLLCRSCNLALGYLKDNAERAERLLLHIRDKCEPLMANGDNLGAPAESTIE